MELITVIVPIYKAEKYLNRCINSIVKQTYQKLDIILLDDGSPDNSPFLCDEWSKKDGRIKVIHQDNRGVSSARNNGLDNAAGEYILMVDSDDYISNDMIEILYQRLIETNADLAMCDFQRGNEDAFKFENHMQIYCEMISGEKAMERVYHDSHQALQYVVPWGKLYKRTLFNNIRYPEGKIFEDIYVTHQILYQCKKIAVIPEKLVYYFENPCSIMNKEFHVGKLDYLPALKERIEFYEFHHLETLQQIAYDEYLHALIWEYSRVKDLLSDKVQMKRIKRLFNQVYKKGYASKRYPAENTLFLGIFNINPESVMLYWKVSGKIKKIFKRNIYE